jgi:hypothetical protein
MSAVMPPGGSALRTKRQGSRHAVAHLHTGCEAEHVGSFLCRQRLVFRRENVSDLFECKSQLVGIDELTDERLVPGTEPVA